MLVLGASSAAAVAMASGGPEIHPPNNAPVVTQQVAPTSDAVTAALPALNESARRVTASEAQDLRNQIGAASEADHGPVGLADFDSATTASVVNSSSRAVLVGSGDDACLVLPDPAGGYGATCANLDDVTSGHAFLALGPAAGSADNSATIAVVVPKGGKAPSVRDADGSESALAVDGNVAAAIVPISPGATLVLGDKTVSLSTFLKPGSAK